jgi:inhibitor of cysteine peptidase
MITLGEHDSGRTVELRAGETLEVRLNENPGTGYRWAVELARGFEELGSRFESGGAVGAAGVRVFQFRAPRAGNYELRLKQWREWEGESSVTARFNATIVAK